MARTGHEADTPLGILERVRDPHDDTAWDEFYAFCDPLLRRFCRELRLDPHTSDEVCQEAWHRLWPKMQTFEYDPGRKFRHWLWVFFRNQTLDYLKSRRRSRQVPVDFSSAEEEFLLPTWCDRVSEEDETNGDASSLGNRVTLLAQAEEVQSIVKSRVKNSTWQAFWLIQIEGHTTEEAAGMLRMSYLATFKATWRVAKMLEAEGKKLLGADRKYVHSSMGE